MSRFSFLVSFVLGFFNAKNDSDLSVRDMRQKEVETLFFSCKRDRVLPRDMLELIEKYVWSHVDYERSFPNKVPELARIGNCRNLTLDKKDEKLFFTRDGVLYAYDVQGKSVDSYEVRSPSLRSDISSVVAMESDQVVFSMDFLGLFALEDGETQEYKTAPKYVVPEHLVGMKDRIICSEKNFLGCIKLLKENLRVEKALLLSGWMTGAGYVRCLERQDGWIFSGHAQSVIKRWSIDKQRAQEKLYPKKTNHYKSIDCIAAHPFHQMIAFGGLYNQIEFWDNREEGGMNAIKLKNIRVNPIASLSFTHDGACLVAGTFGASTEKLMIWDIRSLKKPLYSQEMLNLSSVAIQKNDVIWVSSREGVSSIGL